MGSSVTEEQQRVRALLSDTITLLCKNGLSFQQNMTIQGLIGITLDNNVFLVHLNENFRGEQADSSDIVMSPNVMSPSQSSEGGRKSPKRKRRRSSDNSSKQRKDSDDYDPDMRIKPDPENIILIDEVKVGDQGESSCMLDEGLNYAMGSIQSFQQHTPGGTTAKGSSSASDSFQARYHSTPRMDSSQVAGMARTGPFVTGIVPNQNSSSGSASGQDNETGGGSFPIWDGNQSVMANWAGHIVSQTMSSPSTSQTLANMPPGASTSAGGRTLLAAGLRMSTRQTRTELSLKEKLELINIAEATKESNRVLARRFGIGKTQVGTILKRRQQIREAVDHNNMGTDRKRYGYYSTHFGQVNQATWEWFSALQAINIPVTGSMIQEKAKEYAFAFGKLDFKASNGWLDSFKRRHSIGNLKSDAAKNENQKTSAENSFSEPIEERNDNDYIDADDYNVDGNDDKNDNEDNDQDYNCDKPVLNNNQEGDQAGNTVTEKDVDRDVNDSSMAQCDSNYAMMFDPGNKQLN